ncbi:hypothetical protein MVEN_01060800 [Mycena venus]|uniref:Uncharacterized protein n=1 Tax=Mycena venus TaxID=2733690 RepID=A0A8H7CX35_9AGAR|nr:hypothetical protein MVEN_01060800 [Mycena venus]
MLRTKRTQSSVQRPERNMKTRKGAGMILDALKVIRDDEQEDANRALGSEEHEIAGEVSGKEYSVQESENSTSSASAVECDYINNGEKTDSSTENDTSFSLSHQPQVGGKLRARHEASFGEEYDELHGSLGLSPRPQPGGPETVLVEHEGEAACEEEELKAVEELLGGEERQTQGVHKVAGQDYQDHDVPPGSSHIRSYAFRSENNPHDAFDVKEAQDGHASHTALRPPVLKVSGLGDVVAPEDLDNVPEINVYPEPVPFWIVDEIPTVQCSSQAETEAETTTLKFDHQHFESVSASRSLVTDADEHGEQSFEDHGSEGRGNSIEAIAVDGETKKLDVDELAASDVGDLSFRGFEDSSSSYSTTTTLVAKGAALQFNPDACIPSTPDDRLHTMDGEEAPASTSSTGDEDSGDGVTSASTPQDDGDSGMMPTAEDEHNRAAEAEDIAAAMLGYPLRRRMRRWSKSMSEDVAEYKLDGLKAVEEDSEEDKRRQMKKDRKRKRERQSEADGEGKTKRLKSGVPGPEHDADSASAIPPTLHPTPPVVRACQNCGSTETSPQRNSGLVKGWRLCHALCAI